MILDPLVLSSIKGLSLMARQSLDGFKLGLNLNHKKGAGLEFSNYRSYQAGDDLRNLDWKMFARSDRYFIRESEVETHISMRFLLDASASMNHEDSGIKKFRYAQILTACMAYLARLQGDAFGLSFFSQGEIIHMPQQTGMQGFDRFCYFLENNSAQGFFPVINEKKDLIPGSFKKTLYIFISDFYQKNQEQYKFLDTLRGRGHEIWAIHLLGKNELEFHYPGFTELEDLETGARISIGNGRNAKEYTQRIQAYLANLKNDLLKKNIAYSLFLLSSPLNEALKLFLKKTIK